MSLWACFGPALGWPSTNQDSNGHSCLSSPNGQVVDRGEHIGRSQSSPSCPNGPKCGSEENAKADESAYINQQIYRMGVLIPPLSFKEEGERFPKRNKKTFSQSSIIVQFTYVELLINSLLF